MPLYSYKGFDKEGKKRKGLVEGLNEADGKQKLRDMGVMVTTLEEKKGAAGKENLKGERLVNFTVQLSHLVGAGVPIYQALMALEEQYRGEAFDRILLSLCEKIKAGTPLSEAMADFPDTFDRLYCSMIAAGESCRGCRCDPGKIELAVVQARQTQERYYDGDDLSGHTG